MGLGLSIQWVGNGIISYYFAPVLETVGITSATQQQGINGGLQVYNWFLSIASAPRREGWSPEALPYVYLLHAAVHDLRPHLFGCVCQYGEQRRGYRGYRVPFPLSRRLRDRLHSDSDPVYQRDLAD